MVLIYTTCREETEARSLASKIIEGKLATCVNIWRIGSIYKREGTLHEEKEVAMLIKTIETKVQEIEDFISTNHSYSTPFVGVVDVRRVNRNYKEWMSEVVG
ncbi:hypothetical protein A3I34_03215 [Candidatus Jorgensenbacteria bacterium RIFCSPLOWO2_02_FULL_45_12]|uniref:Cation tolerance protein CutA n=2 Tax=Candidatus Joergenseniibacteriota TaxID=1752739 RepID=A0A1F6BQN3_9BACT|nr:MAG: Periplasmic divalent cation tolerance protein CutA [Candidatus Jorgensenbacteria bacterium GW2011_GWA2_45_9]OGG39158.1 MAG: hypothetical protein A3D55_01570 [Candidatus Jorgensenbacteria bacterium RIFCSPHIGHO2_02_FULL_45_20]OGG42212.1 MAG: hypothetical protein A3I34_03215 [Candidatus Jorgensenbacteria bacterium RIFCSPLOWO2_02_FULL_45_12]